MPSIKTALLATAKMTLAGALIWGVAWAVGVFQLDGTVAESQADILSLEFIELSESAQFARGLEHLGHDEPQTLSINGNAVHFSMNTSKKRPDLLMREYQEEFVRQGINDRVWDGASARGNTDPMLVAAMMGSVVPLSVTNEYASMGGVLPGNGADTEDELVDLALEGRTTTELFKGHRHIEMFWDKHRRKSTVTASWADESFDYAKMVGEGDDLDVDPVVPACPGCTRLSRVRDLNSSRMYSNNIYSSSRNQQELLDYYRQTMSKKGWQETDSSTTFNAMTPYVRFRGDRAGLLQLTRGDQFLTILGYPDDSGKTTIHTVMSN